MLKKIDLNKISRSLTLFLSFYMMTINIICKTFSIPRVVRNASDIIIVLLAVYLVINFKKLWNNKYVKVPLIIFLGFVIHTIIGLFVNWYSPFLYIWGARNIFRFFISFFCTIICLRKSDISLIIKTLFGIFFINVIIVFIQYVFLDKFGDAIGGTFTLESTGGNAGLFLLTLLVCSIAFTGYLNKKINLPVLTSTIVGAFIVAIFAEIKAFYVLLPIILVGAILLNSFNKKTILVCVASAAALLIGVFALKYIDEGTYNMLNLKAMFKYVASNDHGYSSENDISRFRAFEQINDLFFKKDIKDYIWGMGLGNCDVSSISIFNSPFSQQYGYLHYLWFMHSMLYIENGIIGYLLFMAFFIVIAICCFRFRNQDEKNKYLYNSTIVMSVICMVMTVYNSSLRLDVSYFIYMYLALPFVAFYKSKEKNINEDKSFDSNELGDTIEGEQDVVSIIVPIYKVEKYINKCVDSIINQTYKNIEIILVDDGSPDKCGDICDEYAKIDNRIKVVHKENGGLSSARNAGLDVCIGKYICFIDSDDYVDRTYVEDLYKNIKGTEYDFVTCNFEYIYEDSEEHKENDLIEEDIIIDTKENLMSSLFERSTCLLLTLAWNKIYKRELFENLRYTEGIIHEDDDIAYKILDKCNKAKILNKALYNYLQRGDSIMGAQNKNFDKSLVMLDISKDRSEYLKKMNYSKSILNKVAYNTLKVYLMCAEKCYKNNEKEKCEDVLEKLKIIEKSQFKNLNVSNKIKYIIKRIVFKFHV